MVQSAANHGIYLFLDPMSSGYDPGPGGFDPSQHSTDEMRQWGEFWGSRYKNYSHVNFALGNDRLVSPQVDSLVSGLTKYMPDRLITIDWIGGPPDWSSDATGPRKFYDAGHRWVNLNAWYEYHAPQWATWYHYNMLDPVMPTCIFETIYEHLEAGNPKHILTPTRDAAGRSMGNDTERRFRVRHSRLSRLFRGPNAMDRENAGRRAGPALHGFLHKPVNGTI